MDDQRTIGDPRRMPETPQMLRWRQNVDRVEQHDIRGFAMQRCPWRRTRASSFDDDNGARYGSVRVGINTPPVSEKKQIKRYANSRLQTFPTAAEHRLSIPATARCPLRIKQLTHNYVRLV